MTPTEKKNWIIGGSIACVAFLFFITVSVCVLLPRSREPSKLVAYLRATRNNFRPVQLGGYLRIGCFVLSTVRLLGILCYSPFHCLQWLYRLCLRARPATDPASSRGAKPSTPQLGVPARIRDSGLDMELQALLPHTGPSPQSWLRRRSGDDVRPGVLEDPASSISSPPAAAHDGQQSTITTSSNSVSTATRSRMRLLRWLNFSSGEEISVD